MLPGIALDIFLSREAPTVEKARCIHMRFAGTGCRRCLEVCPRQAISLAPGPTIDSAHCNGCLLCESACPTGAFAGDDSLIQTLTSLDEIASPVIGCNHREGVEAHARVGCLGLLASPEILVASSMLLPQGVTLNLTCCGKCPNGSIVLGIKAALEGLSDLPELQIRQAIRLIENEDFLRFEDKDLSRREFLTFFRNRSTEAAVNALDRLQQPDRQISYRAKKLPQRRSLLLGVLPGMVKSLRQAVEKRLFPEAIFHDSCHACSGCVGICPTGALVPALEHATKPRFEPTHCTDCGLCEKFCQHGSITLTRKKTGTNERV